MSLLAGLRTLIAAIGLAQLALAASAAPLVLRDGAPSAVLAASGVAVSAAKPSLPRVAEVAVAPEPPAEARGPFRWVTAVPPAASAMPEARAALPWARGPPFV